MITDKEVAANLIASAIVETAKRLGIANNDHSSYSGAQILHLLECIEQVAQKGTALASGRRGEKITLSGSQLLEALDLVSPDRETDRPQLEGEVVIQWAEHGHSGKGYYCHYADYPEEGAILLNAETPAPVTQERP